MKMMIAYRELTGWPSECGFGTKGSADPRAGAKRRPGGAGRRCPACGRAGHLIAGVHGRYSQEVPTP